MTNSEKITIIGIVLNVISIVLMTVQISINVIS
jgi:hypothetical protein